MALGDRMPPPRQSQIIAKNVVCRFSYLLWDEQYCSRKVAVPS